MVEGQKLNGANPNGKINPQTKTNKYTFTEINNNF